MKEDGLQRMLNFLNMLAEKNIHFFIEQYAPDYLTVSVTLVGVRLEVMFSVEEMQFSYFRGAEAVLSDDKMLYDLIKEYGE
jgi:hypothetical protein